MSADWVDQHEPGNDGMIFSYRGADHVAQLPYCMEAIGTTTIGPKQEPAGRKIVNRKRLKMIRWLRWQGV